MKSRFISILLDPGAQEGGGGSAVTQQQLGTTQQEPAQQTQQGGADRGLSFNPSDDGASGVGSGQEVGANGASGVAGLGGGSQGGGSGEGDWESVVDVARGLGYDFGGQQFQDDRQFLLHLLNTATSNRQADYYAQLGRQIAPQYQQVQQFLQQQQRPQQQQQQRPEWEPPDFDPSWLQLVERDPQSGVFLARQGVDPAIATAVNTYDRWYQRFGHNPVAAVRPFVEQSLPQLVQQQIQQAMQSYRQQSEIESIVARNAEWMYQHDQSGRPVIGVGGRPVATAEGTRYGQIVSELEQQGLRNPGAVDRLARQILMGEMAQQQLRAGQQNPPDHQQTNALASSRSQRNVLQSLNPDQRQQTAGANEPDASGMSLHEMLRNALASYSDADLQNPDFNR